MEHGNNEKHEQTDISVTKVGNKRKRKMVEPLKNQFDSSLRRDKDIENELRNLKRNQQLILEKLDLLTNSNENKKPSLPNPCQLKPTLPGV